MQEELKYEVLETENGGFKTTFNKVHTMRKKWSAPNPKQILTLMPGMVIEIKVKAGDAVKKGDCLLLFKAMKMNNNILAPFDGVIKSVEAPLNENLKKNTLLIEFE
ncbi:MAG: biotin/lipoyl-containing protein [Rikenellaceae bacterium]